MKKGIVLLTGFLVAFSIFLVGCGNEKSTIKVTDTNDKTNFKESKHKKYKPKDFKKYYESTAVLYTSIIDSMIDKDFQAVKKNNEELTQQLNEIDFAIKDRKMDSSFKDDLYGYLNSLIKFNKSIAKADYDSTPDISYNIGTSLKKLAENHYNNNLPSATISFIKAHEDDVEDDVKAEASKEFGVGDKQTLGGITVTLVSVAKTSERNRFDDTKPKNVVKISYKVENNSGNEYYVNSDIDVYDSNSTMGTRYPLDNTTGKILNGKNMNAEYYAGVDEGGNIEIVFNLFSDAILTFHAKI
ncbi:hypothetical protein CKA04_13140 [Listeria monocytogenes]|nr:hypothetical protein [Listeria monocytogenes]